MILVEIISTSKQVWDLKRISIFKFKFRINSIKSSKWNNPLKWFGFYLISTYGNECLSEIKDKKLEWND
jgi:hypothetical protein